MHSEVWCLTSLGLMIGMHLTAEESFLILLFLFDLNVMKLKTSMENMGPFWRECTEIVLVCTSAPFYCPPLLLHIHVAYSLKQVRTWQFSESDKNSPVKLKIKASFFNNLSQETLALRRLFSTKEKCLAQIFQMQRHKHLAVTGIKKTDLLV